MCGFAGFIGPSKSSDALKRAGEAMASAIIHRGPDSSGVWTDSDAGIALAHRRLAVIDISSAGHQPMLSTSGRYVIAFNGEIYNHLELRKALETEKRAPNWRGTSDTETLLAAIEACGVEEALTQSVGMFAFALWDRQSRQLTLARDRLGEKPLYYGWAGSTFLFGSDLAALRRYPDWQGEINRDALTLLMRHNYIPAPHSIYRGIAKLMPGTFRVFDAKERDGLESIYWSAFDSARDGLERPFAGTPSEAVDETERLLSQSLSGQMIADVPLGAFLSGGIDSSAVVALMQAQSSRPVNTFAIGFESEAYDEARHAQKIARHLGTDHTELYVSERDALAVVPKLGSIYSEPFSDSSQIPTYLVSQLARRSVTVSVSGDGGDELFSGYTRYGLADRIAPVLNYIPRPLRSIAAMSVQAIPPNIWDKATAGRVARAGDKIHKAAGILAAQSSDDAYRTLISHWLEPETIVRGAQEPAPSSNIAPPGSCPVRRMMYADLVGYLPGDILTKVDRASMAVSLEARVPLLDHRLVAFAASLPVNILRRNGESKWPLRQLLARHVPKDLFDRPKMGFGVPLDAWLRGPLKDWAEALLHPDRLAREGFFAARPIRDAWRDHLAGTANLSYRLWDVLMFQSWLEAERNGAPASHPPA